MIVFDLQCQPEGHRFEGWFASSGDFAAQQARGLVCCPQCGSDAVAKAPMAPAVSRKGNQASVAVPSAPVADAPAAMAKGVMPPEAAAMMRALAEMQAKALKQSRWVGGGFVEESRAMHYGEREAEAIHGEATLAEAKALIDEGVGVAPLPFPVIPPGKAN
jgi:hypothetical protein